MGFDVAVIGAGPAGSTVAKEIASRGYNVVLLEEHESVGIPQHCAGMLTKKGCELLKIDVPDDVVQAEPDRIRILYGDSSFEFPFEIYVVDRSRFDEYLAEEAASAGSELRTSSRVKKIFRRSSGWLLSIRGGEELESSLVVGAEGYKVMSVGWVGLKRSEERAVCLQYEIKVSERVDQDLIECVFGSDVAPGGYAWMIPIGERLIRIGLGIRNAVRSPKYYLDKLVKERFQGHEILRRMAGLVSIGGPMSPSYTDGYIAVGEAAGQVNPLFGMGCASSIACARIAGETASKALEKGDLSASKLKVYEKGWRSLLGKNYELAIEIRKLLESEEGRRIVNLISEEVNRTGAGLGRILFKIARSNPSLLKYTLKWQRLKLIAYF